MATIEVKGKEVANGAALASFLAAGIGAFALGVLVVLNEAGIVAAPAVYGPAGGVSGRTALATVIWLIGWGVLHNRWKNRTLEARGVHLASVILIGLGILFTFPPAWRLL
jgi:hypothetical protein